MVMQDACPSRPRRRLLAVGALAPLLALGGGTGTAALECDTTGVRRDMISAAAVEALKATGDFAIIEVRRAARDSVLRVSVVACAEYPSATSVYTAARSQH
jgi:hypothetical protein